jgi:hypothetical protein
MFQEGSLVARLGEMGGQRKPVLLRDRKALAVAGFVDGIWRVRRQADRQAVGLQTRVGRPRKKLIKPRPTATEPDHLPEAHAP